MQLGPGGTLLITVLFNALTNTLTWLVAFLEAHSGAVTAGSAAIQAATAVVIVRLTAGLLVATHSYAKTAHEQTKKMEEQRDEMARQRDVMARQLDEVVKDREAGFQPYLYVTCGCPSRGGQRESLQDLVVEFSVVNVGKGPAVSVRGHLQHTKFQRFARYTSREPTGPVIYPGAAIVQELSFTAIEQKKPSAQDVVEVAPLLIEYRDLLGRWWQQKFPVRLGCVQTHSGLGSVYDEVTVAILDQEHTPPCQIQQPCIKQDDYRVNQAH